MLFVTRSEALAAARKIFVILRTIFLNKKDFIFQKYTDPFNHPFLVGIFICRLFKFFILESSLSNKFSFCILNHCQPSLMANLENYPGSSAQNPRKFIKYANFIILIVTRLYPPDVIYYRVTTGAYNSSILSRQYISHFIYFNSRNELILLMKSILFS